MDEKSFAYGQTTISWVIPLGFLLETEVAVTAKDNAIDVP